jgi:hypothetical protein
VATNGPDDKVQIMSVLHQAAEKPVGALRKADGRFVLEDAAAGLRGVSGSVG